MKHQGGSDPARRDHPGGSKMSGDMSARVDQLTVEVERIAFRRRLETFFASRDAGRSLTTDSLTRGIRLQAIVSAAASVAEFADEALAIVQEEYRPRLHCKDGCHYCCCKPGVLASIPELLRVLERVHSTFSVADVVALRERAKTYGGQVAGKNVNDPIDESVPCPLLVDGRCSVYDVRPLVCRGYNSTDVDACRNAHSDRSARVPIFAMLKDVTDGATVGAAQSLKAAGFNDSLIDLGTALQLALASGDAFFQSIMEDHAVLAPAENSSWVTELLNEVQRAARQVGFNP
jgi:Fe-S-cluster containining protein